MLHISCDFPRATMFTVLVPLGLTLGVSLVQGLCGDSIQWSHRVNIDDIYGVWYGVGYAQHNLDMTDQPIEVGCVSLYISDAENDFINDNFYEAAVSILFIICI